MAWLVLRTRNEFAAESLLEAFEELWTVHRLKMWAGYGLALLRAAVKVRDRVYRDGGGQSDDRGPARGAAIGSGADGSVRQHGTRSENFNGLLDNFLHGDLRHALGGQPIAQRQQVGRHRVTRAHILPPRSGEPRHADTHRAPSRGGHPLRDNV